MVTPSPRLLAAARTLAGVNQEALASAAGVGLSTLRKLERGETAPTSRTLSKLERALAGLGVQFVFDPAGVYEGIRHRRVAREPR